MTEAWDEQTKWLLSLIGVVLIAFIVLIYIAADARSAVTKAEDEVARCDSLAREISRINDQQSYLLTRIAERLHTLELTAGQ